MTKNKTLATWLTFLGGPLGLHRFYLHGWRDLLGWFWPLPTAIGWYGVQRVRQFGVDDYWSWILIPLLGFSIAAACLNAIIYGLKTPQAWNGRFNQTLSGTDSAGQTQWLTIGAVVCALLVGATSLMASIAFSFQRYFEYQIEAARQISQ